MADVKVKCGNPKCKHEFWMKDTERKACPKCGKVAVGEKAGPGSSRGCFIITACVQSSGLPDNCIELETMRYLRNAYLAKSEEGRMMIKEYYETAPHIVAAIKTRGNSDAIFKDIHKEVSEIVSLIKIQDLENAVTRFREMMLRLEQEYLLAAKQKTS